MNKHAMLRAAEKRRHSVVMFTVCWLLSRLRRYAFYTGNIPGIPKTLELRAETTDKPIAGY